MTTIIKTTKQTKNIISICRHIYICWYMSPLVLERLDMGIKNRTRIRWGGTGLISYYCRSLTSL